MIGVDWRIQTREGQDQGTKYLECLILNILVFVFLNALQSVSFKDSCP